jgi:long-chain fatty acid transport protein
MNTTIKTTFRKSLLALGIAGITTVSHAGSFGLIEQSASGQGTAYAGAAALGEDASTIYFNPAGMTRLTGQQVIVAGHIVSPNARFNNNGSIDALGTQLNGPDSTTGDPAFVPNFYYTAALENGLYAGVGVNVPFGLSTEYDEGWVGRYHALRSEITSININPSIAWKATDTLSFGFGISIQYIDLELTNNIDSYGACINIASQSGGVITGADCVNAGLTGLGIASQDSHINLSGDSIEMGWNVGLLYDMTPKSRIGVAYRSAIKHNVSGDADYTLDPRLQPFANTATQNFGFNILQDTSLDATADLPWSFSLSYVNELDPKWTLLADWTRTGWSNLDVITIVQAGGVPGQEATLDLVYQDTNRYSLGVSYQHNEKMKLRGGLAYDETPIRSPEHTSARIPGNDRTWLSIGAGYRMSTAWTFDIGYSHLFISDTEINNNGGSSSSNATLIGTYESKVDIFSAQANFNF